MSPAVWITGATGGIGSATARAYARRGARLALLARSPGRLADLERECRREGAADVLTARADVLDVEAVEEALDSAARRFGRVDVVVHSAAVVAYGRLGDVPEQVWSRTLEVGVLGAANVARSTMRLYRGQGGGSLVIVGSVLGQIAVPYMSAYVTAKWGVRGLVRCLQLEARQSPGIHVAIVSPGAVDTAIYRLAATYGGREGRPPPPVISADRVAARVLRTVDRGRTTAGVGPANAAMRIAFTATPWLFDRLAGPLMRLAGTRNAAAPTDGNVWTPSEDVAVRTPGPSP